MSEPASISAGIAARYAQALFELARSNGELNELESDVNAIKATLKESADLMAVINSPIYSRESQMNAILAVATRMKLSKNTIKALGLMASKRRLFVLPSLVVQLHILIAREKGEVSASVISAKQLTKSQSNKLSNIISSKIGKDVKIDTTVDEGLIGGLVIKIGSKMFDTSIRSKLNSVQNLMKEVG